jgi:hypothetical protein
MSNSVRYVARHSDELNAARVFDAEGRPMDDSDAACLGDMLSELLDEMVRRGFDPGSASFTIDRNSDRKAG